MANSLIPSEISRLVTKSDIVAEQVKDVLSVTSFVDLLRKSDEAASHLKQLNIFKFVDVIWDTAKGW